jgi:DNA-binding NtrC family response regulator
MTAVPVEVELARDGVLCAKACDVAPGKYEDVVVLSTVKPAVESQPPAEEDASLPLEPLEDYVARVRTQYVERALALCDGNRSQAARMLKVDPRTMFRHLAKKEGR